MAKVWKPGMTVVYILVIIKMVKSMAWDNIFGVISIYKFKFF